MTLQFSPELKTIADALKSLRKDSIIRTNNLVGDLGEYYCKKLFNLTLHENPVNEGYDAKDDKGARVEIKTRRLPKDKSKIIFSKMDFHYCLFVELDENFEPVRILKANIKDITKNLDKSGDRLSIKKYKMVVKNKIVFQRDDKVG